jgi:hypothetical protein
MGRARVQASNTIKVWNNGAGVPVDIHKEEGVYVPELIFGHLLTSSNYDDNEKKVGLLGAIAESRLSLTLCHGTDHWRTKRLRSKACQHLFHPLCGRNR